MFKTKFFTDMGKTEREVAFDLWALGELVQANHGSWSRGMLEDEAPDLAYMLDKPMLIRDVIFENRDGVIWCIRNMKWHDLSGSEKKLVAAFDMDHIWAGGKSEGRWKWVRRWIELFGGSMDAEVNRKYNALLQEWRDYYQPPARPKPKREGDTAWMEELSTQEVAHQWAIATVMNSWYFNLQLNHRISGLYGWMRSVWAGQMTLMKGELEYRTEADPQPRSSKRKTEAAKDDFRRANLALVEGMKAFFTDDFVKMVRETAMPFNVADLDYERLPEAAPEQKPIRWMSDGELVRDFMRFLEADFDADSFEYEDRELLMDNLRKQYARIKGQKVGS